MDFLNRKQHTKVKETYQLLDEKTPFAVTEAYRSVRTNLSFMSFDEKCRVFAFTSGGPAEGKTTNCINTALTMSQTGKKVLLIDADMRKPKVHRFFKEKVSPGLSEYLAGMTEAATTNATEHKNLFVITAGKTPPNPAELLTSKAMTALIKSAQAQFDYIFIDTPPVNLVTDAVILADIVSGYVVVVRSNRTRSEELTDAVAVLKQVGANIVGFLLNDISLKGGSYKYKSKYNGYKYKRKYESYEYKEEKRTNI